MPASEQLVIRSHVARDLLQSGAVFKTDKLVVWEYVSNGLQYVDPGTSPVVRVRLNKRKKSITIQDNGRGMDWDGLQNFFIMHGENLDRKQGTPGRGRFGTGKSAAFGIANVLRITTVRDGHRSRIEVRRQDVEAATSGEPIPVRTLEREGLTTEPNGTLIEIEEVQLRRLDPKGIIEYIERHLARWPRNATVFVDDHECEYHEPPVAAEHRFRPEGDSRQQLGDVELIIKVSKSPLDEDLRGVSILSNGVWHETTLAGSKGREMAQYIFGEIDVPRLDEDDSTIPPFDLSRSMTLNPNNDLVQAIYAFIGPKVEKVRRQLVDAEKRRQQEAVAKKLAKQASEIARVINEDFSEFQHRVARARARAGTGADLGPTPSGGGHGPDDIVFGRELPATVVSEFGDPGRAGGKGGDGDDIPNRRPQVVEGPPDAEKAGQPAGGTGNRQRSTGGFGIKFGQMGVEAPRALYVADERTIHINLDHPQLSAAMQLGSIEDPAFRRLSYEVAFAEYSIALSAELAAKDEFLDPSDAIVAIRDTLNRVARKAAALYTS